MKNPRFIESGRTAGNRLPSPGKVKKAVSKPATDLEKRGLAARELNVYRSYPRLNFLGEWKQSLLLIESIGLGTPSLGKFTLSAAVPGEEVEFLWEGVV